MTQPLGILHLTTFLQGGAGRAIVDLACAQHGAGHQVTVVTSSTATGEFGNYPEYLARLRAAGVALHAWDSLFTRDVRLNCRIVDLLCRWIGPQSVSIIHAHAAVPAFIGGAYARRLGRRVPIVQTQHGWGTNKTAEQAAFDLKMLATVDRVITTSHATADLLSSLGARASSMLVIPCGIPSSDDAAPPVEAVQLLSPLRQRGLAIAGCIGSVTANKNQALLLDALSETSDIGTGAVFIGEGSEALAHRARACGIGERVVACGYQPHAARWLPLLDLLVVPSRTEGQGLVVLEAFRAGVLVIASHIPALAELIEDGRTGLLFDAGDARALAAALQRACALPATKRRAMVAAAYQRCTAEFGVDEMVARHERLYSELVSTADRAFAVS